jgi:thiol-disulfide isomerase/thioredoxin
MISVIRISAIWCSSCIIMKNRYDEVFKPLGIKVTDYDFDDELEQFEPLKIGSILPVVILYSDAVEVMRIVGEKSKKELIKLLEGIVKQ